MKLGYASEYDWEAVEVPPDWTTEKDYAEFESRFGKPNGISHFDDVRNRIDVNIGNLHRVLDRGLRYFGASTIPNRIPEKAAALEELVRIGLDPKVYCEDSLRPDYINDSSDVFRYFRLRWSDYESVLLDYNGRDTGWLCPLVYVCDALGCAAIKLNEFLGREHRDFDERMGELEWKC